MSTLRVNDLESLEDGSVVAVKDLTTTPSDSVLYTVGAGGTHSTMAAAFADAARLHPATTNGTAVEVRILNGTTITEQVDIAAVDLRHVKLTSETSTVAVDTTGMDTTYTASFTYRYLFLIRDGAQSPQIGVQFVRTGGSSEVVGFYVHSADLMFLQGSGARSFWKGLHVVQGARVTVRSTFSDSFVPDTETYNVDFSGASRRAVDMYHGCHVNLPQSMFYDCAGDYALYGIWGGSSNFKFSDAHGCTNGNAFAARDAHIMCARDCDASYSDYGYYAIHGGRIDARSHGGVSIEPGGDGGQGFTNNALGCRIGVRAYDNSHINAGNMNCRNCTGTAIQADTGATITAENTVCDGSYRAIQADKSCTVDFTTGLARNLTFQFCILKDVCTLNARSAEVSCLGSGTGDQDQGIYLDRNCIIDAEYSTIVLGNKIAIRGQSDGNFSYAAVTATQLYATRGSRASYFDADYTIVGSESNKVANTIASVTTVQSMSVVSGTITYFPATLNAWTSNGSICQ